MGGIVLLSEFLKTVYVPSRLEIRPESIRQMEVSIRAFARSLGHSADLSDLTEQSIRQWLAGYRENHSAATTNSKRCHLLAIWQTAFEEELLDRPPRRTKIRKARSERRIPEAWTPQQVAAVIESAKMDTKPVGGIPAALWWESLMLVAYDTGARRSELRRVAPADISLAGGWVLLQQRKQGSQRIAVLHKETIAACRRIYDPYRQRMWPWPWSREAFDKRLRKILIRAGVPWGKGHGGSLHKLRRTSGTLVEANGGDGARQIGDTRRVFEAHYLDTRFIERGQLGILPRPRLS